LLNALTGNWASLANCNHKTASGQAERRRLLCNDGPEDAVASSLLCKPKLAISRSEVVVKKAFKHKRRVYRCGTPGWLTF